jgi:fluoride exporter
MMTSALLVFLGAGLGGVARYGMALGCARFCGSAFPYGTMAVNILGSLLMGLVIGWLAFKAQLAWSQSLKLFLTTGILGGFTTFSAFSLEAVLLWERGETAAAGFYIGGSVILSILGLLLGLSLMRGLS